MSKRAADEDLNGQNVSRAIKSSEASLPTSVQNEPSVDDMDVGEFEDPYGDDFESDEEIIELDEQEDDDENMDEEAANRKIEELERREREQQQELNLQFTCLTNPGPWVQTKCWKQILLFTKCCIM